MTNKPKKTILPDNVYHILKWLVMVVLPAFGTLYFALSSLWGLPHGEAVVGTVTSVSIFLGTIIGVSNYSYTKTDKYAGDMFVNETENKLQYQLELGIDPQTLKNRKDVNFRVRK